MKSLDASTIAALSGSHVVLVTLVKLEFPSGTIGLNSSNWVFDYDGTTYRGAYGLGNISPLDDAPGELPGIQMEFLRADSTYITLALDEEDEVQGSAVSIYTAILDPATFTVLHVELDWTGYADVMSTKETASGGVILLTAESKGVDLLRGNPHLYNDADQQSLVPGDRIFNMVVSQEGQPFIWPTAEALKR